MQGNTKLGLKIRKADPSTIQNKFLVGYEGWFSCPGDSHDRSLQWRHWFDKPIQDGGHPLFDLWPDTSEYTAEELYDVPGLSFGGKPARLFSSRNPTSVDRHFSWMAQHGIDGAFTRRWANQCEIDGNPQSRLAAIMRDRDSVSDSIRKAAENHGRVWSIMYDLSGVDSQVLERTILVDWKHLIEDKSILQSPNYLRDKGRPVIGLWGIGFNYLQQNPRVIASLVSQLRTLTPGGAYILAGVSSYWRSLGVGDQDVNPAWLGTFELFDAISPWTISRLHDITTVDEYATNLRQESSLLQHKQIDYMPTVFPGLSMANAMKGRKPNEVPRLGGTFLWRQLYHLRREGVRMIYAASFDEYDDATALMPAASITPKHPSIKFLGLDADGVSDLPSDWFLRICGMGADSLKQNSKLDEVMPKKILMSDYWYTRPRLESASGSSAGASGSGANPLEPNPQVNLGLPSLHSILPLSGAETQEWKDEPPPPPYSLEAEETQVDAISGGLPIGMPSNRTNVAIQDITSSPAPVEISSSNTPFPPLVSPGSDYGHPSATSSSSSFPPTTGTMPGTNRPNQLSHRPSTSSSSVHHPPQPNLQTRPEAGLPTPESQLAEQISIPTNSSGSGYSPRVDRPTPSPVSPDPQFQPNVWTGHPPLVESSYPPYISMTGFNSPSSLAFTPAMSGDLSNQNPFQHFPSAFSGGANFPSANQHIEFPNANSPPLPPRHSSRPSYSSVPHAPHSMYPTPNPFLSPTNAYSQHHLAGPTQSYVNTPQPFGNMQLQPFNSPGSSSSTTHPFPQPNSSLVPSPSLSVRPPQSPGTSYIGPITQPFPSGPSGMQLSNQARLTIDQLAGEATRKQLEKGVETVFETGSKWLNKFKK